jgi:hypothetical protein
MKEYQAVIHRLTQRTREDEDALTDLLNERMRSGWEPAMVAQDDQRLTIIFQRETETDRSYGLRATAETRVIDET